MLEVMIGGNQKAFYYIGSLSEAEFMTYASLSNTLGPEVGFSKPTDFKFFVFKRNNKRIIVPSHPIGRASFKTIYQKGMVYGDRTIGPNAASDLTTASITATVQDKTVAVGGDSYIVRLMKGSPTFVYDGLLNNPSFDPPTEWEDFYYNLYVGLSSSVIVKNSVVPPGDKVTYVSITNQGRLWMLVQGANISSGIKRGIGRGRLDVSISSTDYGSSQIVGNYSTYNLDMTSNVGCVWFPVFEKI